MTAAPATSGRPVAIVTGASRNIGRAIAVSLAQDGYFVACFARNADDLRETVQLITQQGGAAAAFPGDAANEDDLRNLVAGVVDSVGRIDVLVNNAGIIHDTPSKDLAPSEFRAVLEVNLVAYFALASASYPYLSRSPAAAIINIGSIFGSVGVASRVAYCASKAGVEGLTRALATEWAAQGIRVVCVAPGYVESDITKPLSVDPRLEKAVLRRIPQHRLATPAEIGRFVSLMAGDAAAFLTGQTVIVDGGQLAAV